MKNGDFSNLVSSAGTLQVIYDPLTTQSAANNYARTPFTYNGKVNNIDPSRISPLMKYLYSLLPEPNIPGVNPVLGNNYSAPNPNIQNQYTYSMRFDQRISAKRPGVRPHHQGQRQHLPPQRGRSPLRQRIRQFPYRHITE